MTRTNDAYTNAYRNYVALLEPPKYLLANQQTQENLAVDFREVVRLEDTKAFSFFDRTSEIMNSPDFRSLFQEIEGRQHVEHLHPRYNIVMMAKWDALERAALLTDFSFSHYIWMDFGLGGRYGRPDPYLPKPRYFNPIERDRIVLSADPGCGLPDIAPATLRERVRQFREQVAGSLMIVPSHHVLEFCELARSSYALLLDLSLTSDDQNVIDICVKRKAELFHLSYAPRGLTKFNHIDAIIHGRDRTNPIALPLGISTLAKRHRQRKFRALMRR